MAALLLSSVGSSGGGAGNGVFFDTLLQQLHVWVSTVSVAAPAERQHRPEPGCSPFGWVAGSNK